MALTVGPFVLSFASSVAAPFVGWHIRSIVMQSRTRFSSEERKYVACVAQSQAEKISILNALFVSFWGVFCYVLSFGITLAAIWLMLAMLVAMMASLYVVFGIQAADIAGKHFSVGPFVCSMSSLLNASLAAGYLVIIASLLYDLGRLDDVVAQVLKAA